MSMVQLNARVPQDLKRAARLAALAKGKSLSAVIREALEDFVAQSDEEVKELARHIDEKAK